MKKSVAIILLLLAMLLSLLAAAGGRTAEIRLDHIVVPDFDMPYHGVAVSGRDYLYLVAPVGPAAGIFNGSGQQRYHGGNSDILVLQYDAGMEKVLAAIVVGGSGDDLSRAMAIDRKGNVYITGSTSSPDFPYTGGSRGKPVGEKSFFVFKLDPGLRRVEACRRLATGDGLALAVSGSGEVAVAGRVAAAEIAVNGHQSGFNGGESDVLLALLSNNLRDVLAATYLGGSSWELPRAVTFDREGRVAVAGFTDSPDFPTTAGTFDRNLSGTGGDGFVAVLGAGLDTLVASTFLGGSDHDVVHALADGGQGAFLLAGLTASSDFPGTSGRKFGGGLADAFVGRLTGELGSLQGMTLLGGSGRDWAFSLLAGSTGKVFIAGDTDSADIAGPGFLAGTDPDRAAVAFVAEAAPDLKNIQVYQDALPGVSLRVPLLALHADGGVTMAVVAQGAGPGLFLLVRPVRFEAGAKAAFGSGSSLESPPPAGQRLIPD